MPDLLLVPFSTETKAEAVRQTLLEMHGEFLIGPHDTIIAIEYGPGQLKLNKLLWQAEAGAAVSGMFWGSLVELLFVLPAVNDSDMRGAELVKLGINDVFMMQAGNVLRSGNAVLLLLVKNKTTDKVLAVLRRAGSKRRQQAILRVELTIDEPSRRDVVRVLSGALDQVLERLLPEQGG